MSSATYIEEKEIIKINNKEYTVITRCSKDSLSKESLIKLIIAYVIRQLRQEDIYYE